MSNATRIRRAERRIRRTASKELKRAKFVIETNASYINPNYTRKVYQDAKRGGMVVFKYAAKDAKQNDGPKQKHEYVMAFND